MKSLGLKNPVNFAHPTKIYKKLSFLGLKHLFRFAFRYEVSKCPSLTNESYTRPCQNNNTGPKWA